MLKGKNVIITGSTSGIGLGVAQSFAAQGCNVLFNGFGDQGEIDALVKDTAEKYNVRTEYSAADMSKPDDIANMVATCEKNFGSVDVLVNNAGIQHVDNIEDFPTEKWDAVLAINLSSAFHAAKAAMPGMKQRNFGRIINIASAHGLVASAQKAAYVAAKHGLVGLTKVIALEVAQTGITCNAICPGWVLTPLVQKQIDAKAAAQGISVEQAEKNLLGEKQPSLRFVKPEQLGALAVFLCGENGSAMTGEILSMDGGWTAQ